MNKLSLKEVVDATIVTKEHEKEIFKKLARYKIVPSVLCEPNEIIILMGEELYYKFEDYKDAV